MIENLPAGSPSTQFVLLSQSLWRVTSRGNEFPEVNSTSGQCPFSDASFNTVSDRDISDQVTQFAPTGFDSAEHLTTHNSFPNADDTFWPAFGGDFFSSVLFAAVHSTLRAPQPSPAATNSTRTGDEIRFAYCSADVPPPSVLLVISWDSHFLFLVGAISSGDLPSNPSSFSPALRKRLDDYGALYSMSTSLAIGPSTSLIFRRLDSPNAPRTYAGRAQNGHSGHCFSDVEDSTSSGRFWLQLLDEYGATEESDIANREEWQKHSNKVPDLRESTPAGVPQITPEEVLGHSHGALLRHSRGVLRLFTVRRGH
ncbi:hypothetical protein C8F04DRAFT_1288940 [Mycena alexandri]|uniref:Uncharacterized protein n=1 Tax=Mycena alexandri TaxID=1745969 RepID=A0AAD6SLW4_9AGAR|nr:hypothetical protein C8F04DRAFT_1288940 [Mycena alexandri]